MSFDWWHPECTVTVVEIHWLILDLCVSKLNQNKNFFLLYLRQVKKIYGLPCKIIKILYCTRAVLI